MQTPDWPAHCHALTEHAPLPMATVEGATHVVRYVNPAFCRMMDKAAKQLIGQPISELLPKRDTCVALIDRVFRSGKPEHHTEHEQSKPHCAFWSYTIWPVQTDQRLVGVMIQVTETTKVHGKTVAMNEALILGSLRQHEMTEAAENLNEQLHLEIIQRNRTEGALRESEEKYRALFELGPVAIYSCDPSGAIQNFNHRATELWGRTPVTGEAGERFCGSFKMFHPDGHLITHDQCPMADVLSGKRSEVRDTELLLERTDGTRIAAVVSIRTLKNARGKITGAINCFYDVTQHKLAEAVQLRVAVLDATNRKLKAEISQRRAAEKSLKKIKRHQELILEESRHMQNQLQQLSHQFLSAQEEERKRISRELHDVIAQTLTGINLQLATLKRDAALESRDIKQSIARTQELVENSVNIVHRFARELRPTVLDDLGLIPALQSSLKSLKEETGIHVSLTTFTAVENVLGDKRIVFYRVAQEALTNVTRHAKATRVDVTIQRQGEAVCLTIKDNGKGFPAERTAAAKRAKRLGLLGMRERLEMVGGNFSIKSVLGKGTTVTAQVPLGKAPKN